MTAVIKGNVVDEIDSEEAEAETSGSAEGDDASGSDASNEESSRTSPEPEARVLPKRATRGNKMAAVMEDEDEADQEFWGQDFFAEEERDTDWESSGDEVKDTVDSDFDKSEDEGEDEGEKEEPKERKSKALVAPGAEKRRNQQAAGPSKPRQPAAKPPVSPATQAARAAAKADAFAAVQVPQLRASTRARVEVAVKERDRQEQVAKKRPKPASAPEFKPLTQEELLAEAAKTELDNERSLQSILAREEEIKKRQAVSTTKFEGVSVRFRSRAIASGSEKVEQTRLEVLRASEMPMHLRPRVAPPHAQSAVCCITGLPARYRHPSTGAPYATAAAFAELDSNGGHPHAIASGSRKRKHLAFRSNNSSQQTSSVWQGDLHNAQQQQLFDPLKYQAVPLPLSAEENTASAFQPLHDGLSDTVPVTAAVAASRAFPSQQLASQRQLSQSHIPG